MAGSRSDRGRKRAAPPPPIIDLKAEELREPDPATAETPTVEPAPAEPSAESAQSEAQSTTDAPQPEEAKPSTEETATDPEPQHEESPPPPPPPPSATDRARARTAIAGFAAAVVIAGAVGFWLYHEYGRALFPDSRIETLDTRIDQAAADASVQADRLAAIETGLVSVRQTQAQVQGALDGLRKAYEESTAAARQSIEAGDSRIAEVERSIAETRTGLDQLRSAMSAAGETGANALLAGDLKTSIERLTARLADAEARLTATSSELEAMRRETGEAAQSNAAAADEARALGQAASALAAKLAAGQPYATELDALAKLDPGLLGLDALRAHAATGVSSPAALADKLAGIATTLSAPKATDAPTEETGMWSALWARLASLVKVRRIDEVDWPGLARNAESELRAGRLAAAIGLIEGVSAAPPPALSEWLGQAKAQRDTEGSMQLLETAVLQKLGDRR